MAGTPVCVAYALERAVVLDPTEAPLINNLDLRFYGGVVDVDPLTREGLAPGAWTYVVSAVFNSNDTDNPGGESLPSEPITLYAPDVPDGVEIELTWDPVLGADNVTEAVTYRIYRTSSANASIFTLRLLAEVTSPTDTFLDQNPASFLDAAKLPRTVGDLGEWRALPAQLVTPRAAYGIALANDPACSQYLYVVGGRTDVATQSATYEYATFNSQTGALGAFTQATGTALTARRELAAFVSAALKLASRALARAVAGVFNPAFPLTVRTMRNRCCSKGQIRSGTLFERQHFRSPFE